MTTIIDFLEKNQIQWFPIIIQLTDSQLDDPYITGLKKKDKILKPIKNPLYLHYKTDNKNKEYKSYLPQYDDFWKVEKTVIKARQQLYFNNTTEHEFNAIWIDTLNNPEVDVDCPIDSIDDKEVKALIDGFIQNAPYYKSMTKPYGKHFIFAWDETDKPTLNKLMYNFKNTDGSVIKTVDFLCGQGAYASINACVENFNETLQPWDNEFFTKEYLFIEDKPKKSNNPKTIVNLPTENKNDLYDKFWNYFSLINNDIMGNYKGWFNSSCIHKNIVGDADFDRFNDFSASFDGYDEDKNKTLYDNINEPRYGWKKLYEYAYVCNSKGKLELDEKYKDPAFSIAKFINIKSTEEINKDVLHDYENIKDYNSKKQTEVKKAYENELERIDADLYKKRKCYFEKFHAKILNPICFIRVYENDVSIYKKQQLNDAYENLPNQFIERWRKDVFIKTYEQIDFRPPPLEARSDIYNSFKGFRISNLNVKPTDNFDILLEQLKLLTNDEAGYKYMIKYFAHLVQRPGELPCVMILFRSVRQGVGKNLFFEKLSEKLIGRDYYVNTADIDKIVGRFPVINKKFIICLDEAHGKDTFSNNDKLKNICTADKISLEMKGVDAFDIRNVGRYFIFSNNTNPLPIDCSDRRIVAFECNCGRVGDYDYFNRLACALEDDGVLKGFYNFLMNEDITGWRPHIDRPKTELYNELKMANMGVDKKFMNDYYNNSERNGIIEMKATELYELFVVFCEDTENIHPNKIMTQTKFSLLISSQFASCIEKKRTRTCVVFIIDLDKLYDYLNELGFYFDTDNTE